MTIQAAEFFAGMGLVRTATLEPSSRCVSELMPMSYLFYRVHGLLPVCS